MSRVNVSYPWKRNDKPTLLWSIQSCSRRSHSKHRNKSLSQLMPVSIPACLFVSSITTSHFHHIINESRPLYFQTCCLCYALHYEWIFFPLGDLIPPASLVNPSLIWTHSYDWEWAIPESENNEIEIIKNNYPKEMNTIWKDLLIYASWFQVLDRPVLWPSYFKHNPTHLIILCSELNASLR